ncbi:NAD-dependent epimerase/dehydratase family protein [Palleronia sp. KMU-117]|uniref:NAD-dependent epimerase/dehydratase family protein n=1 Tax=Palleronia sp. KMU-117 TaxID=3434108 RepID=UPI003D72CEDA
MIQSARTALVTGSAGFIGHAVASRLLSEGWKVTGIDAMTDYYDPALKRARLSTIAGNPRFTHVEARIEEPGRLHHLLSHRPNVVLHLAAQAGVRHSIDAPETYVEANIVGTFRLLEAARAYPPGHLLLASTSSVYGANTQMPYAETDKADTQMSFYAATKKATEAMAHSYSHLYDLPVTMFRFFTVYGPWGRPDMAPMLFADAAFQGRPIRVFNHGDMARDFTFIDDLVEAIVRLAEAVPSRPKQVGEIASADSLSPVAPYRIVNIGNAAPVRLMEFIQAIEAATGRSLAKDMQPMQPGDVPATWADTRLLEQLTGFRPSTSISDGVARFIDWYRDYFGR